MKENNLEKIYFSRIATPIGQMIAGTTSKGIFILDFIDEGENTSIESQLNIISSGFSRRSVMENQPILENMKKEIDQYFSGKLKVFNTPLDFQINLPGLVKKATDFQKTVWNELCKIPYGQTRSYQEIAMAIGNPKAVRAVGHANSLNNIAIIVPCHRVIQKNGNTGGYAGGLYRKEYLLNVERTSAMSV